MHDIVETTNRLQSYCFFLKYASMLLFFVDNVFFPFPYAQQKGRPAGRPHGWNVGLEPTMGLVGLAATYSSDSLLVSIYKLLIFFLLRLENGTLFKQRECRFLACLLLIQYIQEYGDLVILDS